MRDTGKNIRDLRIRRNMTQDQLAEKLFVTRQTVSNYETGKSRPDIDMLVKIAEVLETDVNQILYGPSKPQNRKPELIRTAVAAAISVGMWILMFLLDNVTWKLYYTSYHTIPRALQYWVLYPFAFLCSGYTLMQLLSLFTGLRPVKGPNAKWMRRGILTILIGTALFLLPFFLDMAAGSIRYMIHKARETGGAFTYSTRVKATALHMFLLKILGNQPWILALFGGALWLVQKPKTK